MHAHSGVEIPTMALALFQPLLADVGQVIVGVLVAFFVLVRWVYSQMQDAKKQAARQRAGPPAGQRAQQPRPPRGQAPAAGANAPAGQQADPLRDQVEAFLRRAAKQQQPNQPRPLQRPPQSPSADKIEILVKDEPPGEQRRTLAEPFRAMNEPAAGPLQQPARRPVATPLTTVPQHVAQYVSASTRALGEHTAQLGQRIVTEDEQFDLKLKAKFDHAVGTLAASGLQSAAEPAASAERPTPAGQIAAMLASPEGVRQAIVLNEILRRPVDRW
jgi:hypothetical protein